MFPGPHSYTGEDSLELHVPGNPVVLDRVMSDVLAAAGQLDIAARLAEPGEFTARAYFNGRMSLTQAGEALWRDAKGMFSLMDQAAERARRAARGQMGRLSIGLYGSGVFGEVPELLAQFRLTHPDVDLSFHYAQTPEQVTALRQGRVLIVFERLYSLRRRRVVPRLFIERFLLQIREGALDRLDALDRCEEESSHIARVFAAAVRKYSQVREAADVQASGIFTRTMDGGYETLALPYRFVGAERAATRSAPQLGAHTADILREIGFAADHVGELVQQGVVVSN